MCVRCSCISGDYMCVPTLPSNIFGTTEQWNMSRLADIYYRYTDKILAMIFIYAIELGPLHILLVLGTRVA